ncbi:MAG: hypothetical protein WD749_04145 [Phycisphaerales bacterium]
MVAHERHITVTEAGQVLVSGLPVRPGQRVRVTVAVEEESREQLAARLREFFKQVQGRPQVQRLTDDEIAREIEQHRRTGAA